jgi:hypothetical protein
MLPRREIPLASGTGALSPAFTPTPYSMLLPEGTL